MTLRSVWLLGCCGLLSAAPRLRLSNTIVFASVPLGAGATAQTLEAFNIGDESLSLRVSVPLEISWLKASVGTPRSCSFGSGSCLPLLFLMNTGNLAPGTYTAEATVSDPHAVDAPQVVTVTVEVGEPAPLVVDQYLAPGATANLSMPNPQVCQGFRNCSGNAVASTEDGGKWLSVVEYGSGSIQASYSWYIHLAPAATMPEGAYRGSVNVTNPNQNYAIPVTMHVTTLPVAVPSSAQISLKLAQGGPAVSYPFLAPISLSNSGLGALNVSGVTASGTGVSAYDDGGRAIVTLDPGSLAPGTYTDGVVTFECNGANCPLNVPVSLEVDPRGPPVISSPPLGGVTDNGPVPVPGYELAPGDVALVRGDQLSLSAPVFAPGDRPLPTMLGGASVLVDGVLVAPIYYSSFGQIAFQLPYAVPLGNGTVQVVRDGLTSNSFPISVAQGAPRIFAATDASNHLLDHPVAPGDPVILWCIGLGQTYPAVSAGTPAPADPLAQATVTPLVAFLEEPNPFLRRPGFLLKITPSFAGLSPGAVGLYEVIVNVPAETPGGSVRVSLLAPKGQSGYVDNENGTLISVAPSPVSVHPR